MDEQTLAADPSKVPAQRINNNSESSNVEKFPDPHATLLRSTSEINSPSTWKDNEFNPTAIFSNTNDLAESAENYSADNVLIKRRPRPIRLHARAKKTLSAGPMTAPLIGVDQPKASYRR